MIADIVVGYNALQIKTRSLFVFRPRREIQRAAAHRRDPRDSVSYPGRRPCATA